MIFEHKRCFVCLGSHLKRNCTSKPMCTVCKGRHVTAMHRDRPISSDRSERVSSPNFSNSKVSNSHNYDKSNSRVSNLCTKICGGDIAKSCSKVLLVDLTLPSQSSRTLRCYAILDEQSTTSFVDPKVVSFFDVDVPSVSYHVRTLVTLDTPVHGKQLSGLKVRGVNQKKAISLPPVLTSNFIPDCKEEIATPETVALHRHIAHLSRNFAAYDQRAEVLLLIGRNCGPAMATRCHGYKAPFAHQTPVGWALVGATCLNESTSKASTILKSITKVSSHEHFHAEPLLPKREFSKVTADPFHQFPDDELFGYSKEDSLFMRKIIPNIKVTKNGSVAMPLPLRNDDESFPDNRLPVFHRTKNTLNKLKLDPDKLDQCIKNMQKNIDDGHIEEISQSCLKPTISGRCWYLPVFPVTHPKKGKVRIVYDSAASYDGVSLNSKLLQGPDFNSRLITVLLRFRMGEIGFTADIESMFYAFHLYDNDRDLVRFFWWKQNDPNNDIIEYQATRHVFGNKCSPSVANIGLRYAVANSPDTTPRAVDFVNRNFYVDDCCGSSDSIQDAIATIKEIKQALSHYNIRLCKITSSSDQVRDSFPASECTEKTDTKDFNHSNSNRTLGVEWNPTDDKFLIKSNVPNRPFTKRGTLATTNSLFDPLGFVAPIILTGRLLQRRFIPSKAGDPDIIELDWDDPLPEEHRRTWENWVYSLHCFDGQLSLHRGVYPLNFGPVIEKSLHIFSDASTEGIGFVAYIRSVNSDHKIHVSFVFGSSKVPPRRTTSIPRLELCAALDAAIHGYKIASDIDLDPFQTTFYSDSKAVLGYLSNTTSCFSHYITRRVDIILNSSTIQQWKYVSTDDNPADIASRPQSFESLRDSCWFRGPAFLWNDLLPSSETSLDLTDLHEVIPSSTILFTSSSSPGYLHPINVLSQRVDSLSKLINVVKLVFDFIRILSAKVRSKKDNSSVKYPATSKDEATRLIVTASQRVGFPLLFHNHSPIPNNLSSLSPFIEDSVIKVGGRLSQSHHADIVKHPVLLPPNCSITKLIIRHYHHKCRHQGRTITLSCIRHAGYFIQNGSSVIKKYIRSCITCKKLRQSFLQQKNERSAF